MTLLEVAKVVAQVRKSCMVRQCGGPMRRLLAPRDLMMMIIKN